ncbi:MAG: hypothetical protein WD894_24250 [Pirellulales bacterium]
MATLPAADPLPLLRAPLVLPINHRSIESELKGVDHVTILLPRKSSQRIGRRRSAHWPPGEAVTLAWKSIRRSLTSFGPVSLLCVTGEEPDWLIIWHSVFNTAIQADSGDGYDLFMRAAASSTGPRRTTLKRSIGTGELLRIECGLSRKIIQITDFAQ